MQISDPGSLRGMTVVGSDGDKIGTVDEVYLDQATQRPEWVAVKTGMFGSKTSLVPLSAGNLSGDDITVPFDKSTVKDAPKHDAGTELMRDDEASLFEYYGIPYGGETATAAGSPVRGTEEDLGRGTAADLDRPRGTVGRDTSGPATDDAMTRSEERLHVGTERVETGRARLRKYVVTEHVQQTVPVTHEEVRIEREPITDANVDPALDGPAISEEEHEVTLHAERPVVQKETVPVERVRLATEQVAGEETVGEDVRKEQVDTDGIYPGEGAADRAADTERRGDRDVRNR